MPEKLCEFTSRGIAEFSKWLRSGAPGILPNDLLRDPEFSTPTGETELLTREKFSDRYSFGCRLVELLASFDSHVISYKGTLWSWLAAWYFDQLCEIDGAGKRILIKPTISIFISW